MNLENFYDLEIEDQQQYFSKTFFRLCPPKKEVFWGFCVGFINKNIAKVEFGERIQQVNLTAWPPIFDFPETGIYNLGKSTIYFHRVPRRQSKKGLCMETAQFKLFGSVLKDKTGKLILPLGWGDEIWRLRSIREIFEESHNFSLVDAMTFFKKKRPISFAINRDFAISLGVTSKYLSLWYKQILVGEVPSPKDIKLLPGLFQQEVIDHFLQENIQMSGVQV